MDKIRRDVTEKILSLTLQIIYLLTLQEYTVVKKQTDDLGTSNTQPLVSASGITDIPITVPPPHERDNDLKILELTNKIIQLLTGEVPVRCQDVAVYLSMEEWEYIEGHQDLYKDIVMEDELPLTSEDETICINTPERFPQPLHCTVEDHILQHDYQNDALLSVKVEDVEEEHDLDMSVDQQCKEEETPTDIRNADVNSSNSLEENLLLSICKIEDDMVTHCLMENPTTPNIHPLLQNADLSSHLEEYCLENSPVTDGNGYKNYQCSECTKSFTQNADLIRHHRVHTGEKPFMCSECGKTFKQKTAFVHHLRIHTGEKPFSCSECGKCFAYKSVLVDHQKIHTGVKPFLCNDCDKCFTRKSDLNRHKRIHTGEKPYSCSDCRKSFNQKANLTIHQKVHFEKKRKRKKETT